MKVSLRSLFCAVGMLLAGFNSVQAEEVRLEPNYEVFQTSAAKEIVFTNHDCSADNLGSGCEQKTCTPPHVGRDFFVCKDRCAGIIAGTETVFLRPYASGGLLDVTPAQMNFNPSQRYWIGYQSADGLGGRIRYWEFDRGATGAGGSSLGVEYRNLDVEMTQAVDFKRWNLLFSGGLRYQETGTNVGIGALGGAANIGLGFDGVGLTFSGTAARDLNQSGSWRMASTARWSAVYGNSKLDVGGAVGGIGGVALVGRDDLVNILELQIGPQYRRRLPNGSYLTLGAGVEAQYYSNGLDIPVGGLGFGIDTGFVGFNSSIAITR